MAKKNITSVKPHLNDTKMKKQKERDLLDSWHPHIENAMNNLHKKFLSDTKFILTESDLKCWLFYYLQQERPYIPFAVHTEVTHYAEHTEEDKKTQEETIEKKHKFRDLSLLCPWDIKANEKFLRQGKPKKELLSKGFLHNAPAIHFELKFVRETGNQLEKTGLMSDIEKLKSYNPSNDSHIRDFVIICGSRSKGTKLKDLKGTVKSKITQFKNKMVQERLRLYLFDEAEIKFGKFNNDEFTFQ